MSEEIKNNNETEVKDEAQVSLPVEIVGINFREAGKIYFFAPNGLKLSVGEKVIVETARGVELGTVKVANKTVSGDEIVSPLKPVTRVATTADIEHYEKNRAQEAEAIAICQKKVEAHGLGMKLVGAEYTFDNSKLIFYFTCESRVDFRELVRDLASTFRTRIELRQIGIRDEAKMLGGIGVCGRKLCCSGFLSDFVQVSIRMAKEQNFSLNSSKVSGACGRLMCCLRYEHETYEEAIKHTPPVGSVVKTADGDGVVVEIKPLAKEIKVRLNDNDKDAPKLYKCQDVKVISRPSKQAKQKDDDDDVFED
ncbi:MAG: stage 0 sporulation family protein [Clostridia bacterium]|nr:stage 0 sporulation family protein [Clostridia bacterium]